jgi:hypothetical protein
MRLRSSALFALAAVIAVSCGKTANQSTSDLSYKLYDPYSLKKLLINRVDSGEIRVFVVGEEDLLYEHISQAISMWTSYLPRTVNARFVDSLSESDLVVEVVSPLENRRQFTTLMPNNRPVITLFENYKKTVLLHEMGHAFGMQDTYQAFHDGKTGLLTSTCTIEENQPQSNMCLGGSGQYKLYPDDIEGIRNLYDNRMR